jgi:predicted nucleic acid-binding protein
MKWMLDTNICIEVSLDIHLVTRNTREFGRVPGLKIEDWQ